MCLDYKGNKCRFSGSCDVVFYNVKGKELLSIKTILFFIGWGIVLFNWHILRSAAMITPVGDKFYAALLVLSTFPVALYYLGIIFWPFNLAFAPVFEDVHFTIGTLSGCTGTRYFLI
jgi:hypothetical protein